MKKNSQAGQSLIEYLIIVALVAVSAISIMRVVGQSVNVNFAKIAKSLGASVEGKIERVHNPRPFPFSAEQIY